MNSEPFAVCITVAAQRFRRTLVTVRTWADRGEVCGLPLECHQDPMTRIRYFRRSQVEAIAALLQGRARVPASAIYSGL